MDSHPIRECLGIIQRDRISVSAPDSGRIPVNCDLKFAHVVHGKMVDHPEGSAMARGGHGGPRLRHFADDLWIPISSSILPNNLPVLHSVEGFNGVGGKVIDWTMYGFVLVFIRDEKLNPSLFTLVFHDRFGLRNRGFETTVSHGAGICLVLRVMTGVVDLE